MRRISFTLVATGLSLPVPLLLAACAAQQRSAQEGVVATEVLSGGIVRSDDAPELAAANVPAPFTEVWDALGPAYEALGIEVQHRDTDNGVLGNRSLTIRRRIGDVRASEYFDCGLLVSGMPAADSYQIRASVTTQVIPVDGETRLITAVGATGRSLLGTASNEVRCASTGRLEEGIRESVEAALRPGERSRALEAA